MEWRIQTSVIDLRVRTPQNVTSYTPIPQNTYRDFGLEKKKEFNHRNSSS